MLHRLNFLLVILSAYLCSASVKPVLTTDISQPAKEQYLRVLGALADNNYSTAVNEAKILINLAPHYDHSYRRLVEASSRENSLEQTKTYLETLSVDNFHAYYGLGLLHGTLDAKPEAIAALKLCIEKHPDYSPAYRALADVFKSREDLHAEAENFFIDKANRHPSSPAANFGLGYFNYLKGRPHSALSHINRALELDPKHYDSHYFKTMTNYYELSDYLSSRDSAGLLLANAPIDDVERRGSALLFRGAVEWKLGNYAKAIEDINIAVAYALQTKNKNLESSALGHLGSALFRMDRYSEAEACWRQALDISRARKFTFDEGRHLGNLGLVYKELNDLDRALDCYQRGLKLSEGKDAANEATLLLNIGEILLEQNKKEEAEKYFLDARDKSIGVSKSNESYAHLDLALVYKEMGRFPEALANIERSLQLADPISDPWVRGNALIVSGFTKLKNPGQGVKSRSEEAANNFREALEIGSTRRMPKIAWQARAGLAAVYELAGNLIDADEQYRLAIDEWEVVRGQIQDDQDKTSFLENKIDVYQNRIALLIRLNEKYPGKDYDRTAFNTSEQARARSFLDRLAIRQLTFEEKIGRAMEARRKEIIAQILNLQSMISRELKLQPADDKKIEKLDSELTSAKQALQHWTDDLRRDHPEVAELLNPTTVNLLAFQKQLDAQSALLEFFLGKDSSYLFVVTKDRFNIMRIPPEDELEPRINSILLLLKKTRAEEFLQYADSAASLYHDLLSKAESNLNGKTRLIIVADGLLHYLPFEILLTRPTTQFAKREPKRYPYLIKNFTIQYVPSASVHSSLDHRKKTSRKAPRQFLAYANPNYANLACEGIAGDLQQLKVSQLEVETINKFFDGETRIFHTDAATEDNVKGFADLDKYSIIHFSVHGHFNDKNPTMSGLFLGGSNSVSSPAGMGCNGLLQVNEIFGLNLNADLVVLSSCETGLGKIMKGEGMDGLTRAFLYAGTPSIVVSLWKVEERSTSRLMVKFYENYAAKKLAGTEALTAAQRAMAEEGVHPSFWAGFIFVGA